MKVLPKLDIRDEIEAMIGESIKITELCKADVVRQALKIGQPQFTARFQPSPIWLEERPRETLAEEPETITVQQFAKKMSVIADGS